MSDSGYTPGMNMETLLRGMAWGVLASFAYQLVMVGLMVYAGREVCEEVLVWQELAGGGRVNRGETEEVCTGGVHALVAE